MATPVGDGQGQTIGEELPVELIWRVHPLSENLWRSVLLVLIISAALMGVWMLSGYPGMVLLGAILLISAVAPYLFPTKYHLTGQGIEIAFLGVKKFRGWEEFRNFYPHEMGVHLSTFRRPGGLDAFRGSFIRFAPGNRDIVLRFLDARIKRSKPDSVPGNPS
jgi:hypothetical protein